MSTGRVSRACLLNSALLEMGVWRKSTAFRQPLPPVRRWRRLPAAASAKVGFAVGLAPLRLPGHFRARSSKRAGGLIPRIALDECRVPERYRTRAPAFATFAKGGEGCPPSLLRRERSRSRTPFSAVCSPPPGRPCAPRSRASAQAGFIRPLCPGQHWGLRTAFAPRVTAGGSAIFSPPCPDPSGRISFVKK